MCICICVIIFVYFLCVCICVFLCNCICGFVFVYLFCVFVSVFVYWGKKNGGIPGMLRRFKYFTSVSRFITRRSSCNITTCVSNRLGELFRILISCWEGWVSFFSHHSSTYSFFQGGLCHWVFSRVSWRAHHQVIKVKDSNLK